MAYPNILYSSTSSVSKCLHSEIFETIEMKKVESYLSRTVYYSPKIFLQKGTVYVRSKPCLINLSFAVQIPSVKISASMKSFDCSSTLKLHSSSIEDRHTTCDYFPSPLQVTPSELVSRLSRPQKVFTPYRNDFSNREMINQPASNPSRTGKIT